MLLASQVTKIIFTKTILSILVSYVLLTEVEDTVMITKLIINPYITKYKLKTQN